VALGNVFGDINIQGGLRGRIAVKGNSGEYGLASGRFGILCNVSISGGIDNNGAIVSAGVLGDQTGGTQLTISGKDKGILAAEGDINYAGDITKLKNVFENASGVNAAAIDAIFTNKGVLLSVTNPSQLDRILDDLLDLTVNKKGNLSGTSA
jgi:hypothetical protein